MWILSSLHRVCYQWFVSVRNIVFSSSYFLFIVVFGPLYLMTAKPGRMSTESSPFTPVIYEQGSAVSDLSFTPKKNEAKVRKYQSFDAGFSYASSRQTIFPQYSVLRWSDNRRGRWRISRLFPSLLARALASISLHFFAARGDVRSLWSLNLTVRGCCWWRGSYIWDRVSDLKQKEEQSFPFFSSLPLAWVVNSATWSNSMVFCLLASLPKGIFAPRTWRGPCWCVSIVRSVCLWVWVLFLVPVFQSVRVCVCVLIFWSYVLLQKPVLSIQSLSSLTVFSRKL